MTPGAATVENTTMDTPVVRNITIPPEALEALFQLLYPYMDTGGSESMAREVCNDACLAMLKNWPGADANFFVLKTGEDAILLPLPKDPSDDK
jgi:hypothetical protein